MQDIGMHLKLKDQQLKRILPIYRLLYQNLMITTNQNSVIYTHTHKKRNPNMPLKLVIKSQEKRTKEEGEKKTYKNKSKTVNKMALRTYISIITLNINGLNVPTERHSLAEWIEKQHPYICCPSETHFRSWDTYRLKVKRWKRYSIQMEIKRKLE